MAQSTNPYSWSKRAKNLTSGVISLEFGDENGDNLVVKNIEDEIEVWIEEKEEAVLSEVHGVSPNSGEKLMIHVTEIPAFSALFVSVKPTNGLIGNDTNATTTEQYGSTQTTMDQSGGTQTTTDSYSSIRTTTTLHGDDTTMLISTTTEEHVKFGSTRSINVSTITPQKDSNSSSNSSNFMFVVYIKEGSVPSRSDYDSNCTILHLKNKTNLADNVDSCEAKKKKDFTSCIFDHITLNGYVRNSKLAPVGCSDTSEI